MRTRIIEATNGLNWGKFMLGFFDEKDWSYRSTVDPDQPPMLRRIGWSPDHLWVMDLQTGEGACFFPGGLAKADLDKHAIWVCPLFEPFLTWLYARHREVNSLAALEQAVDNHVDATTGAVDLHGAPFDLRGYRRPGPVDDTAAAVVGR